MKRNNPTEDLHLELLKGFEVILNSDGNVYTKIDSKRFVLSYRDEGPDAWASSKRFPGPAWVWNLDSGWSFYENGVTITGYHGLQDTVVTMDADGLHVTKCVGEE